MKKWIPFLRILFLAVLVGGSAVRLVYAALPDPNSLMYPSVTSYVVTNTNARGPGSLRQAMADANDDMVHSTITFDVTGVIIVDESLPHIWYDMTIIGPGAHSLTISGAGMYQLFMVDFDVTVEISGLTIRNGWTDSGIGLGPAVENWGTVTIRDCVITNNSSLAYDGGGLNNTTGRTMYIYDSVISNNHAGQWGGGITNEGSLTISNSTISGNEAGAGGGGIFSLGTLTITNSAIYDNSAGDRGGGIFVDGGGTATIESSTISGNAASGQGGGGIFTWGTVTINNSTISDNAALDVDGDGGGLLNRGTVNIGNSIVAGNTTTAFLPNCFTLVATLNSLGHNMESGTNCGFVETGDQQNTDPMLGPLALNGGRTRTHALLNGSPAVNAGSCVGVSTDQRGMDRPVGSACDIGAYEQHISDVIVQNDDWSLGVEHDLGVGVKVTPNTADDPGLVTALRRDDYPGTGQDVSELPVVWTLSAANDTFDLDVAFCYTDKELGQVPEDTLRAYRLDETFQVWQEMGGVVDTAANCVTVSNVTTLSQWALAGDGYVALDKTILQTTGTARYGSITYRIILHNSDVVSYTNTFLTDTLSSELNFGTWLDQPAGAIVADDEITWSGDIASKEAITFTFIATYNGDYGVVISNTAVFSNSARIISDTVLFSIMHSVYLPVVMQAN